MQGFPIPEHIVSYDPSMVRVCRGVAPALCFCFFEELFLSPSTQPAQIAKPLTEWRRLLGMQPYHFTKAFIRIGVTHPTSHLYTVAKLAGREFWSERFARHVFYSMELTGWSKDAILRRNAFEIDLALGRKSLHSPTLAMKGSKASAAEDARRMLRRLAK